MFYLKLLTGILLPAILLLSYNVGISFIKKENAAVAAQTTGIEKLPEDLNSISPDISSANGTYKLSNNHESDVKPTQNSFIRMKVADAGTQ